MGVFEPKKIKKSPINKKSHPQAGENGLIPLINNQ